MSQFLEKNGQSLAIVKTFIPKWIQNIKTKENHVRHSSEGMTDLIIPVTPVKLDENSYNEAKETLDHLLKLTSIPLSLEIVRETLKFVNGVVVNPFSEADFNFKVQAIFSLFKDYPNCIFNQDTARKLAVLNKFFPSGNEIQQVIDEAKNNLDTNIDNLKAIVGYGFTTNEDQTCEQMELQEKRRERQRHDKDQLRQQRINRLNAITQPLDELNQVIQEAVENYLPKNYQQMNGQELIKVFTEQKDKVQDLGIKTILQEKIDAVQAREKQMRDLEKLEIIIIPVKKRMFV